MAKSARQKRITGRVMHEFKHGELKSGPGGKGGPVKSRRQAIAIALEEAGASKYESDRRRARTPKSRPLAAERQPLRVPTAPTAIPGRNFMFRPGIGISKAAQR